MATAKFCWIPQKQLYLKKAPKQKLVHYEIYRTNMLEKHYLSQFVSLELHQHVEKSNKIPVLKKTCRFVALEKLFKVYLR